MRSPKPVSLITCDVDNFRNYNDTYGHRAGDYCPVKTADIIKGSLHRVSDIGARYGGEAFAVIMPETDVKGAPHVAERIRDGLEKMRLPRRKTPVETGSRDDRDTK